MLANVLFGIATEHSVTGIAVKGFDDDGTVDFLQQTDGILHGLAELVFRIFQSVFLAELTHQELVGEEGRGFFIQCRNIEYLAQFRHPIHSNVAFVGHYGINLLITSKLDNPFLIKDV